jgi:RimJ/RimL family protein N-acetyltransferase
MAKIVKLNAIETPRLYLYPFVEADINLAYIGWLNDPDVVRYSNQRFSNHTKESALEYLSSFNKTSNHFLAIKEKLSGTMIGTLTIYHNLNHQTADLGIMVGDKTIWGCGYGKEAFSAVVNILLGPCGVRKVTAGTLSLNLAMIKIMIGAGLKLEASRRSQELLDGQPADIIYYSKFKNG